jgi:putative spermidine/putrescine transport system ATP-binding protein
MEGAINMSSLSIQNVTKYFGQDKVLDQLNLEVEKGEMVTLLGPSGCGKSTLLRCISGLTVMEEGAIILEGQDISAVPPKSRNVGMVFQSYELFPNMTVYDNIAFGLKMHKMPSQQIRKRVDEMIQVIDLPNKMNAYPHELSGGQQQRVALARSLAIQPKVMLMDEPLSALDAKIRRNLRVELRSIQKKLGMTTVFVTHDQEEALTISDRVCVMNKGKIVQMGSPEEIYTHPRTEFVARFIGNYNILSTEQLKVFNGRVSITGNQFAIRPESMQLSSLLTNSQAEFLGLEAECEILEATVLGNIMRYVVAVKGLKLTVDALNISGQNGLEVGMIVSLRIPIEECKVLVDGGV